MWYRIREYYYDSKRERILRTDEEHYAALEELTQKLPVEQVLVDPSAASFMECIRRHGRYRAVPAKNDVLGGIRRVSDALRDGKICFSADCRDSIREFSLYVWDTNSSEDRPVKRHDHAMDDIRYFVNGVLSAPEDDFYALSWPLTTPNTGKEETDWLFFEKGEPRLCVSRFKQRAAQRIRLPVIRCGRRYHWRNTPV